MVLSILAAALIAAPVQASQVKGHVKFSGKAPAARMVHMEADAKCLEQHKEGMFFQPVNVDSKGGLADVFIYVKKGLEGKKFEAPAQSAVMLDQKGCWYSPHVLGVMVGQPIEIVNSDPTFHNVNASAGFNVGMVPGMKTTKVFKKAKVMETLRCNVHAWMNGYVGVVENPFYAVSSKDGSFELKDLPPGKYTVEAWHEKLGTKSKDITVGPQGATLEFSFQ